MRELLLALAVVCLPAAPPAMEGQQEAQTLFWRIARDEVIAQICFSEPAHDYRGDPIAAGTYRLRYAVQPLLKDHAGTSKWRDFAIVEGAAGPDEHPRVIALVPPDEGDAVLELPGLRVGVAWSASAESASAEGVTRAHAFGGFTSFANSPSSAARGSSWTPECTSDVWMTVLRGATSQ